MKINQTSTAIDQFHGPVNSFKSSQHELILSVMKAGTHYSGQTLCKLTGLTPNVISARLFELREAELVSRSCQRVTCPISGASVFAHQKIPTQIELIPTQLELIA